MIFTIATNKGGTGKTTTAAALLQAAAASGKKALAIDLDPQANLSFFIGADQDRPGAYQLLHGADPAEVIQETAQGIYAITAGPDLAAEQTTQGSALRLQKALQPIRRKYSIIIIDTPPMLGEMTYNALQAADRLLIPLETDAAGLQGLYQILDIASHIQATNPGLKIAGTILTRYDKRSKINRYLQGVIRERGAAAGAPLLGAIRPGIAIREAQALQKSLYEYAPKSNPAQDYMDLYKKLIKG